MKVLHSHLAIVAMVVASCYHRFGIWNLWDFYIIRIHDFPHVYFLEHRLIPTLILNLIVYLIMSYPMKKKLTLWKKAKRKKKRACSNPKGPEYVKKGKCPSNVEFTI